MPIAARHRANLGAVNDLVASPAEARLTAHQVQVESLDGEMQGSQWVDPPAGPVEVTVHPTVTSLREGDDARLESAHGRLAVRIRFDSAQRRARLGQPGLRGSSSARVAAAFVMWAP